MEIGSRPIHCTTFGVVVGGGGRRRRRGNIKRAYKSNANKEVSRQHRRQVDHLYYTSSEMFTIYTHVYVYIYNIMYKYVYTRVGQTAEIAYSYGLVVEGQRERGRAKKKTLSDRLRFSATAAASMQAPTLLRVRQ